MQVIPEGFVLRPMQTRAPPLNGKNPHPGLMPFCSSVSIHRPGLKSFASSPKMSFRRCIEYVLQLRYLPLGTNNRVLPSSPPPKGITVSRSASLVFAGTIGYSLIDSFTTARRYLMFRSCSNDGISPCKASTSIRSCCQTSGRLESSNHTLESKDAVVSRPARRMFRSSERILTLSCVCLRSSSRKT